MAAAAATTNQTVSENGRTYHRFKDGKYQLPNDSPEQARLNLQHTIFLLGLNNKLFWAPLEPHQLQGHVLDACTGTAIWAIDFAKQHPESQVLGIDLSSIQPKTNLPTNISFQIADVEDEWQFPYKFSYIHARALVTCFADAGIPIRHAYNALEPGGWLELHDFHMPYNLLDTPGNPANAASKKVMEWGQYLYEGSVALGRPWNQVKDFATHMQKAGAVDVRERRMKMFVGTQPTSGLEKNHPSIGELMRRNVGGDTLGFSARLFMKGLGWEKERLLAYLKEVNAALEALRTEESHVYVLMGNVCGRKPVDEKVVKEAGDGEVGLEWIYEEDKV
jgi:SAM-dependent methyltransferase